MKTFVLAAAAATLLATPAFAQTYEGPAMAPYGGYDEPEVTGSLAPVPVAPRPDYASPAAGPGGYSLNPAADGNADQQDKPTKNYGQVSGGPAAAGW